MDTVPFKVVLTGLTRQCITIDIPGRRVAVSCRLVRQEIERCALPALYAARSVSNHFVFAAYGNSIMQNQARVNSTANSAGTQALGKVISHGSGCPEHRIGILMSQTGRFLECISCRLSFAFPPGTQYETVARQFEAHRCGSVTSSSES